ncbi:hypothetical protein RF11_13350 [Thelohanellus kitauei]|uniref:Uncharacterized protein n=1 Tax=Thelohanellus kitauei TaxID=669202 RepID=A0A0C2JTV9_THEKT|nr:hypothetical protein RF11_13350 [Thelohanellus kitauei]
MEGRESSMQFQMIKNSQNSKLMKRWRELNEMEYSQGLNSILKSESEVPITKAFTFSSSSSVPLQSDSQSQIQPFDSQKSVFTRSTYPSVICVPKLELDSISTYSQMTPKTNHAHGIQNVSKTMSRFGFVASDEPMINPISMNKNKDDSKNSSLINSISKFFKG